MFIHIYGNGAKHFSSTMKYFRSKKPPFILFFFIALIVIALFAPLGADPPPALQDSGDCGIEPSQERDVTTRDSDGNIHDWV